MEFDFPLEKQTDFEKSMMNFLIVMSQATNIARSKITRKCTEKG